jgi:hypothetical protein
MELAFFYKHGTGYAQEMHNRRQTLYGLEDPLSARPPGCSTMAPPVTGFGGRY